MAFGAYHAESPEAFHFLEVLPPCFVFGSHDFGEFLIGRRGAGLPPGPEFRVASQLDVGAAARHVRRYRDGTLGSRLGDDESLPRVVLGVEHFVPDALSSQ